MDGALIIDKPPGMTSHDVVAQVRRITGERRVGHTGTLDPFATGVLVLLVGRATRLAQFLSGAEKEYEAIIRLGYATDTGDVTGQHVSDTLNQSHAKAQSFRKDEIEAALASLRGQIEQTPPMYSAKKIAGKKLYELARRGAEVERKAVQVTVSVFEALDGGSLNDDETCDLSVRVVCSAGTYIRTLAEDFGQRLGIGAHLASLRRIRAGGFKIDDAIALERLSGSVDETLISPDAALSHLPALELSPDDVRSVQHGIDLQTESTPTSGLRGGEAVRMRDPGGQLIAVGRYDEERLMIHPEVVLANHE